MAKFRFALYLVTLFLSLEAVSARNCHACSYHKYGNEEQGNKHCKAPTGGFKEAILTGCNYDALFRHVGCGKLAVKDGKFSSDNSPIEYGVYRGCVDSRVMINGGCTEKTVEEWGKESDEWSEWVVRNARSYSADTKVEACYCTEWECNAAPSLTVSLISVLLGLAGLSALTACLTF